MARWTISAPRAAPSQRATTPLDGRRGGRRARPGGAPRRRRPPRAWRVEELQHVASASVAVQSVDPSAGGCPAGPPAAARRTPTRSHDDRRTRTVRRGARERLRRGRRRRRAPTTKPRRGTAATPTSAPRSAAKVDGSAVTSGSDARRAGAAPPPPIARRGRRGAQRAGGAPRRPSAAVRSAARTEAETRVPPRARSAWAILHGPRVEGAKGRLSDGGSPPGLQTRSRRRSRSERRASSRALADASSCRGESRMSMFAMRAGRPVAGRGRAPPRRTSCTATVWPASDGADPTSTSSSWCPARSGPRRVQVTRRRRPEQRRRRRALEWRVGGPARFGPVTVAAVVHANAKAASRQPRDAPARPCSTSAPARRVPSDFPRAA